MSEINIKNNKWVKVSVPATTANMGPGFDSIGMALELYNHFWVTEIEKGLEIESNGGLYDNSTEIKHNRNNLIYTSMCKFYQETNAGIIPPVKILHRDFIPMTRGLGSSATCIVGGLLAANEISGMKLSTSDICTMASMIEGHPDNTTPAIVGGIAVGAMNGKDVSYVKLNSDTIKELKFAVIVPSFFLSTKKARNVLPKNYSTKDTVFNLSRSALLVAAFSNGDLNALSVALDDRVHQPYRMSLVPNMKDIFNECKNNGAIGTYLSGAGPTIISIIESDKEENFINKIKPYVEALENQWEMSFIDADLVGATVEIVEDINI